MIFISRKKFEQEVQKKADEKMDDYFRREEERERHKCLEQRIDCLTSDVYQLRAEIDAIGELVGNIDA